ncbi:hypothetical protein HYV82_06595 [Candidatus Woesearchaeota archaeon]|nr:hypothetical protein [Candidatus Woesearchaeota archaeon]
MNNYKVRMKTATALSFAAVLLAVIISLAFFEAGARVILRNSAIAVVVFMLAYFAWLKINESYEKFFRQGLGR